jgi:sugar lactone lactonase YvrE
MPRLLLQLLTLSLLLNAIPPLPISHSYSAYTVSDASNKSNDTNAPALASPTAVPLPRSCGRVTPPGEAEPVCCINGAVYLDGQAVSGAQVQVQVKNRPNAQVTLFTQPGDPSEPAPLYQLNLSGPPINAQIGEELNITASYGDYQSSTIYKVRPGSQQVNLALPHNSVVDYIPRQNIPYIAPSGTFLRPFAITNSAAGEVIVLDSWNNRIQVFDRSGHFIRQFGSRGTLPGQFDKPLGVAVDAAGNIYIADTYNDRIQKLSSIGIPVAIWGGYGQGAGQFYAPTSIALGGDGKIYIVDMGNSRIQVLSSTGDPLSSWGTSGNQPGQFSFSNLDGSAGPSGIAVDNTNNVYVADTYNDRVQKFSSVGGLLDVWPIPGNDPSNSSEPTAIAVDSSGNVHIGLSYVNIVQERSNTGTLRNSFTIDGGAEGITIDGLGNMYIVQWSFNRVQKLSSAGNLLGSWGSGGSTAPLLPEDIALDSGGNLYIADIQHNRIQKMSSKGELLYTIDVSSGGNSGNIAVDTRGNIYVTEATHKQIQKLSNTGQLLARWDISISPRAIAVDNAGTIYVTDIENDQIHKFSNTGQLLDSWGTIGSNPGQFQTPFDLAVDSAGNIYVADTNNERIQKLSSTGEPLAAWGSWGSGPGQFRFPTGIAVDSSNNIYVADTGNARIVKLSSAGQFLTTWGTRGSGPGQFLYPTSITGNSSGTFYVADGENFNIQSFSPASYARPIATISSLSTRTLAFDATLEAHGMGQDSDSTPTISSYRWILDNQRQLSTSHTLSVSASSLSPGTHTISFIVKDDEGEDSAPVTFDIQVATPPQAQWTMLLYLDGDYDDQYALLNSFNATLESLKRSLPNGYVRIAALADGPDNGDTRRLLISPGIPAKVEESLIGEQDMDDPAVLTAFLRWGQKNAPAQNYYLAVADHGQALQGIAWDKTSDLRNDGKLNQNAYLTIKELGEALRAPDVSPITILHLDACSMSLLDVAYEVRDRVEILISSQYLGWSYFAYDRYQILMEKNTTARQVAIGIVNRYADIAIADDNIFTISVLNLRRVEPLLTAVDALAGELAALVTNPGNTNNRPMLDTIRQSSQTFESNDDFINTDHDEYIDLVDWATRIRNGVIYQAVNERAATLITELTGPNSFVLYNRAQSGKLPPNYARGATIDLSHASGISIFYPAQWKTQIHKDYLNNQLFTFTQNSRWPDFLIAVLGLPQGVIRPPEGPLGVLFNSKKTFIPLIMR